MGIDTATFPHLFFQQVNTQGASNCPAAQRIRYLEPHHLG